MLRPGKGDENDSVAGIAQQADFRKGRVLFGFPPMPLLGSRNTMSAPSNALRCVRPTHCARRGTASAHDGTARLLAISPLVQAPRCSFRQRGKCRVQPVVERGSPTASSRHSRCRPSGDHHPRARNTKRGQRPILAGERAQESEFENVANIASILITHIVSNSLVANIRAITRSSALVRLLRLTRRAPRGRQAIRALSADWRHRKCSGEVNL